MIKLLSKLFAVAPLLLIPVLADASIVLELTPVAQTASRVDIALQISGLGDGTTPSLSTFDVDVSFDAALLDFSNAAFGDPVLGDQLDLLSLGGNPLEALLTSPGLTNLYELSLDSVEDLDNLQADSFTLAVLTAAAETFTRMLTTMATDLILVISTPLSRPP